jgi:tight adherence protein B
MLWISLLVFVSVLAIVLGGMLLFLSSWRDKKEIGERLSLVRIRSLRDEDFPSFLKSMLLSEVPFLNRFLKKSRLALLIDRRLKQGDLSIKVGTFILLTLALFAIGAVIGHFLKWPLILSVMIGSILSYLPSLVVDFKRSRRLNKFMVMFPDTLEMFSRSLRAGHSFIGAIQLVAQEMPAPVGPEFQKVFDEQNLGIPLRKALLDLTERVDSMDLKFFVTAVLIQRDTGGNLTEIIDKISYVIRERFRVQGQLRIFTAQARLSGFILALLPPLLVVVIYFLNPDYLRPLWDDKLGNYMIGMAIVLQVSGVLVIRKIVRIKI